MLSVMLAIGDDLSHLITTSKGEFGDVPGVYTSIVGAGIFDINRLSHRLVSYPQSIIASREVRTHPSLDVISRLALAITIYIYIIPQGSFPFADLKHGPSQC